MTTTQSPPTSTNADPPSIDRPARTELLPPPAVRKELRRIQGLTQEQAAAELGVSDGSWSNWENKRPGPRNMRGYLMCLLRWAADARAMGIPINWPAPADPQK